MRAIFLGSLLVKEIEKSIISSDGKAKTLAKCFRISSKQFRQVVRYFVMDLTASQIALLTGLNRNVVNWCLRAICILIARLCETESPFGGEVEVDESYFSARQINGKHGRGAYAKIIVFRLFQRDGQVCMELVTDCHKHTLQAIIRRKVALDSIVYSGGGEAIMGWSTWGRQTPPRRSWAG